MYNEAIESYDEVIKKNPNNNNTDLWHNKGLFILNSSYASEDEYVHNKIEALKCYDKIIEINPNHVKAWIKKGLIHEKELGSYADAIKCYDKAIEINSNYADNAAAAAAAEVWLYLCYANAYRPDRRYGMDGFNEREILEKALDCINKALECNSKYSDDPYIWASKGEILFSFLGRYEEAIKCFDKALEIDPAYYDVLSYKEIALKKLGKDEDARKCFDQRKILHLDGQKDEDFINLKRNKYGALIKFDGTLLDDFVNEWW